MKVRFRITFEGTTEQELEWYREEGETEDPSEGEALVRFQKWVGEQPAEFLNLDPGEVEVRIDVSMTCPACGGKGDSGNAHLRACITCDGKGEVEISATVEEPMARETSSAELIPHDESDEWVVEAHHAGLGWCRVWSPDDRYHNTFNTPEAAEVAARNYGDGQYRTRIWIAGATGIRVWRAATDGS